MPFAFSKGSLNKELCHDIIPPAPEEKGNNLERGQFRMDKDGVIRKIRSAFSDRVLVPSSLRQEVISAVHNISSYGQQSVQRTKENAENFSFG